MSETTVFEDLGREIAEQHADAQGESIEQTAASATKKLQDDDLIGFALVAMRQGPDGVQTVGQRAVDPVAVAESDHDADMAIGAIHDGLVETFDEEVRER
jgi:hypothetical protein